jgi:hypothetical protein
VGMQRTKTTPFSMEAANGWPAVPLTPTTYPALLGLRLCGGQGYSPLDIFKVPRSCEPLRNHRPSRYWEVNTKMLLYILRNEFG